MKTTTTRPLLALAALLATASSCTQQRDLFVETSPLFVVKADWSKSTLNPEVATALVYNAQQAVLANPAMQPPTTTRPQRVEPDTYDILVLNNQMFSPSDNGFAHIFFRGTDRFATFEAHATVNPAANPLFRATATTATPQVMVHPPDVIAAATHTGKRIDYDRNFVMKYQDGIRTGHPEEGPLLDSVRVTPLRLTRTLQVVLRVRNYKPKFAIYGTLRGLAQGVNLTTRQPTGSLATHAGLLINKAKADPDNADCHILTSELLTTFGPWWNAPTGSHTYTLDLLARYNGQGDVFNFSFDVTNVMEYVTRAMEPAMATIRAEEATLATSSTPPKMATIVIEAWLTLPDAIDEGDGMEIEIEEWGEVVIVPIPIKF